MIDGSIRRQRTGAMAAALLTLLTTFLVTVPADADELAARLFDELGARFEQARTSQVPLLAPSSFDRADRAYSGARQSFERGRPLRAIRGQLDDATRYLDEAFTQAELARASLTEALAARQRARSANAPQLASASWEQAERALARAITTLERGRSDRGQTQATELTQTYAAAELEAIQQDVLGALRERLAAARAARLERLVPQTLTTAQQAHDDAQAALARDRYDTERPRTLAQQGFAQVAHAEHLAGIVQAINARETTLESVLLTMEAPLIEIAHALDVVPDLSRGIAAPAADTLDAIRSMQRSLADAELTIAERDETVASLRRALGGAAQETLTLNALLEEQQRRRHRLERVETLFRGDEAQVLRIGNQLIIRLVGLSFASGSAELRDTHRPLLAKALDAIRTFPDPIVTIEGHTDAVGAADANRRLSQQRADAVRRYLLDNSQLTQNQVAAMGFGDERPVATNDTPDGRARNRRIDIVIARVD
jgi:OmpA-OmpF porin, OOP family